MTITDILTNEQADEIVSRILVQARKYRKRELEYKSLCNSEFAPGRQEHSLTLAIISAFPRELKIKGIDIGVTPYGRGMFQPELILENGSHIQIYHKNFGYSSMEYLNKCAEFNQDTDEFPIYACIVFDADRDGMMKNIKFIIPNHEGKKQYVNTMYEKTKMNNIIAV